MRSYRKRLSHSSEVLAEKVAEVPNLYYDSQEANRDGSEVLMTKVMIGSAGANRVCFKVDWLGSFGTKEMAVPNS